MEQGRITALGAGHVEQVEGLCAGCQCGHGQPQRPCVPGFRGRLLRAYTGLAHACSKLDSEVRGMRDQAIQVQIGRQFSRAQELAQVASVQTTRMPAQ